MSFIREDVSMRKTTALPNGAATVFSVGIDTGTTPNGDHPGDMEWEIEAPVMNATQMPDGKTMTYSVMTDTVLPVDGSSIAHYPNVIVQTGAGGAGCAGVKFRFRLPSVAGRIVGVRAVGSATGNASTANVILRAFF